MPFSTMTVRRVGSPFAVEGRGAEQPGESAVINDGYIRAGDLLAQLVGPEGGAAIHTVSIGRFKDIADKRAGNLRGEDNGHPLGRDTARIQAAKRAPGRFRSDTLRRIEPGQRACAGEPVVPLHSALLGLRDGHGGERAIGAAIFAGKTAGVGQHLVSGRCVEAASVTLLLLDAGIGGESCCLGAPRILDALRNRQTIDVFVVKIEIARRLGPWRRAPATRQKDLPT